MNNTIEPGAIVRSFDFADTVDPKWGRDLTGERACYIEGLLVCILPAGESFAVDQDHIASFPDCDRYVIRSLTRVWQGRREAPREQESYVFPPVNGTPSLSGQTSGVELVTPRKS